ncbi:hypothetical protein DLREEDagrD3_28380 [Denitratisoma sp. agr-D3]
MAARARHLVLSSWLLAGSLLGATAVAGELPDPTRPALAEATAAAGEAPGGAVLQSVFRPRGGRPSAVISGQTVELGGEFGGARLTRVAESEVTLQSEAGKEVLKLTPAVEKTVRKEKQTSPMVQTRKAKTRKAAP